MSKQNFYQKMLGRQEGFIYAITIRERGQKFKFKFSKKKKKGGSVGKFYALDCSRGKVFDKKEKVINCLYLITGFMQRK